MRRILTAIVIACVLAIPSVVAAKPFGYMGPGRAVGTNFDHATRKGRNAATFKTTLTKPVPVTKSAKTVNPSQPTKPKSTVGFNVAP